MFERFTERARKVMALANQEAQRFNHHTTLQSQRIRGGYALFAHPLPPYTLDQLSTEQS